MDYRYLAERLRALYYLPLAGSFQPPAAAPPQYASRVTRQSTVDWLFDAIARGISPARFATMETLPTHGGRGTLRLWVLRPRPAATLALVRDAWLTGQIAYHARNAVTMRRLACLTEQAGALLSRAVVVVVAVDIALVGLYLLPLAAA
ncbi:hypothetical protein [uncultured Thiodictyon sp.]|uniref:hypothetical protein n=1 Tax=uncultured Thiodictyon sp. TaxID=1846217 RepID=UPI0025D96553|nr:hypothetical protein [uncultured Thiodictyon sp.]